MYEKYNHQQPQKTKMTTKIQKKKQYELKNRKRLFRKQTQLNREIKQNERKQKGQNLKDEDFDVGRFFESASSDKIYVNRLGFQEIKNEILLYSKSDFGQNGSMIIEPVERQTNIWFKNNDDF